MAEERVKPANTRSNSVLTCSQAFLHDIFVPLEARSGPHARAFSSSGKSAIPLSTCLLTPYLFDMWTKPEFLSAV